MIAMKPPNNHVKRLLTPDDESAMRQPTDNIPPRDVIRTFMATRPTPDGRFSLVRTGTSSAYKWLQS